MNDTDEVDGEWAFGTSDDILNFEVNKFNVRYGCFEDFNVDGRSSF